MIEIGAKTLNRYCDIVPRQSLPLYDVLAVVVIIKWGRSCDTCSQGVLFLMLIFIFHLIGIIVCNADIFVTILTHLYKGFL